MINVKCVEALKSVSDNLFQPCRFQATFTLVPPYSNYVYWKWQFLWRVDTVLYTSKKSVIPC